MEGRGKKGRSEKREGKKGREEEGKKKKIIKRAIM